jgi:hypothetical protein
MLARILIAVISQEALVLKWRSWRRVQQLRSRGRCHARSLNRSAAGLNSGYHVCANMPVLGALDPRVWQHLDP